jgi:hypothetical protein
MIYAVCITEAVALVAVAWCFTSLLRAKERAAARREDLLLNQLLHAVGRPWQPAPADESGGLREAEPYERELPGFSATPEQWPVY